MTSHDTPWYTEAASKAKRLAAGTGKAIGRFALATAQTAASPYTEGRRRVREWQAYRKELPRRRRELMDLMGMPEERPEAEHEARAWDRTKKAVDSILADKDVFSSKEKVQKPASPSPNADRPAQPSRLRMATRPEPEEEPEPTREEYLREVAAQRTFGDSITIVEPEPDNTGHDAGTEMTGHVLRRPGADKKGRAEQVSVSLQEARELKSQTDNYIQPAGEARFNAKELEAMADEGLISAPRRSEIAKVDTKINGYWEDNPNTDDEVQDAMRMPIVAAQHRTLIEHLIAANPTIQGPQFMVDRVRRWFDIEMEIESDFTRGLDRFVVDTATQMLSYGTCTLVKQRTLSRERNPYKHPKTGTKRAPVWGYAIPDGATMEVFLDKFGRSVKWRQQPRLFTGVDAEPKPYQARDVHMLRLPTQNRSLYFWTPTFAISALYAINVLRELQKEIDAHSKALVDIRYYAQVGSKDWISGEVTRPMIRNTSQTINQTPRGGTPVFPWYVGLEKLDIDEHLEKLLKAAEYWKQEVRLAIGGSQLSEGDGSTSNRNTADAFMDADMRSTRALVPEIQRGFRWLVWDKLFEWADQGDFADEGINSAEDLMATVMSYKDVPTLVFSEIDLAEQIRRETHAVNLWQAGLLRHKEARERVGEDPAAAENTDFDTDEELDGKFWFEIQSELKIKESSAAAEAKSKMNPENQHGQTTKPKRPDD